MISENAALMVEGVRSYLAAMIAMREFQKLVITAADRAWKTWEERLLAAMDITLLESGVTAEPYVDPGCVGDGCDVWGGDWAWIARKRSFSERLPGRDDKFAIYIGIDYCVDDVGAEPHARAAVCMSPNSRGGYQRLKDRMRGSAKLAGHCDFNDTDKEAYIVASLTDSNASQLREELEHLLDLCTSFWIEVGGLEMP